MVTNHKEHGFTLFELLIALAIVGIVIGGVVGLIASSSTYHTRQEMMVTLTQDLRAAKHLMADEIRSAGCNPINIRRIGFEKDGDDKYNTDANSIHFQRDIDNDDLDQIFEPNGNAGDPGEDISYYRIDSAGDIIDTGVNTLGTLIREDENGPATVIERVNDLQFIYFDDDNEIPVAELNTNWRLDDIRMVEVVLTGQVFNPQRVTEDTQTSRFKITIRNTGI